MQVELLGPLVVRRGDTEVTIAAAKQRALLTLLALHRNEVVPTDRLVDELWGGGPPATAIKIVQGYVSQLRKFACGDALETHPRGYLLRLGQDELDTARLDRLVIAGCKASAAGDPATASSILTEALALWRGPPLAEFRFDRVAAIEISRLEELRLLAIETRLEADLALGRHEEIVPDLQAIVQEHPLRENLRRLLMLALYRAGRQAEALAAYQDARKALVDELGVDPGEDLRELEAAILVHDPALALPRPSPSGIQPPRAPSPPKAAEASRSGPRRTAAHPAPPKSSGKVIQAAPDPAPPGPRRFPRRRSAVRAGAAVIVLAAGTLAAVAWSDRPTAAQLGAANSAVEVGTNGGVRVSVPLGQPPSGVVATASSVWIAEPQSSTVVRLDAKTRRRTATIPVGTSPGALTMYAGELWVADSSNGEVQEVSTATNTAIRTVAVGHGPSALAGGLGYLWVANQSDGTITRIDPSRRGAARTIAVGSEPDGVAVGDNAVWVSNEFDNTVTRIDPSSLATRTIPVGVGPVGIAVSRTAVWVADNLDLTVARIDLLHGDSVTKVRTGDSPTAVVEFDGSMWASNAGDATISRLDEASGRVTKTYAFGSSPTGLSVAGSALWVSSKAHAAAAHRGGTLTVATVTPDDGMASIDPALAYDGDLYDGMAEVYDTLTAIRKSTGLTGLDLVPDLAEQLPVPTNNGLTYVFVVRPGITYSTGRPVLASDFRRGIERTLIVEPSSAVGYFNDIVGAGACTHKPAHCDLSKGIFTDDAAGTVTINLTKADPDLLGALSITGFSAPVPPSTPMTHDVGTTPVPGTGPYTIEHFSPNQSLTLVRNPHFVRWSSAAQPDGYPDQIVWKGYPNQAGALAAVGAGSGADVIYINRLANRNANLTRLLRAYPQQLISTESYASHYLVLNSKAPPFNNPQARHAVAQALTADPTLAAIDGGTASCTIAPPGFPGQPPWCAYTENRTMAAATVRSSGTEGDTVHVYFVNKPPFIQLGKYVAEVLNQIGYHAILTLEDDYDATVYNPKTRPVNIEGETWFPDFPSESQFWLIVACNPPSDLAALGSCNPAVDSAADAAFAAQAANPSLAQLDWQHVYSLMDTDARLVPLDVPPGVSLLVSPRVGNPEVTPSSALEALLDQFWVQ